MESLKKKIITFIFRVSISIAMLIFLFNKVDREGLFLILQNSNVFFLAGAFLFFFFNYAVIFFRWKMFLDSSSIKPPVKKVIVSFLGGLFFNLILPSTIGGDLVRSIDLGLHTRKTKEVVATVFMDRLSGYIGMVLLALTGLFLGWDLIQEKSVLILLFLLVIVLVAVILIFFNPGLYKKINLFLASTGRGRIRDALCETHKYIHLFKSHKRTILFSIFMSMVAQAIIPATFYVIAQAIGVEVNPGYLIILLPIINAITLLPISIGGLGVRDAAVIFFFAKIGIARDQAFAMSLLNFFFLLMYSCAAGLFYIFAVRVKNKDQQRV